MAFDPERHMKRKQNHTGSSVPLLLSGLVCPGMGQCAQKRWCMGLLYAVCFTGAALWLLLELGMYVVMTVRFYVSGPAGNAPHIPLARVAILLAVAAGIYGVNLVDVIWVERRKKRLPGSPSSK